MSDDSFGALRAAGRMVIDMPRRQLAVYPNAFGDVVLLCQLDGRRAAVTLDASEVDWLIAGIRSVVAEVGQQGSA